MCVCVGRPTLSSLKPPAQPWPSYEFGTKDYVPFFLKVRILIWKPTVQTPWWTQGPRRLDPGGSSSPRQQKSTSVSNRTLLA